MRLDSRAIDDLATYAETPTAAATIACDALPTLVARALNEIRGRFTPAELNLMLDALNGCGILLRGDFMGMQLILEVGDAIDLNGADRKWKIERGPLLEKLGALTSFQRAALELWAARLWLSCEDHDLWEREIARLSRAPEER